MPSPIYTALPLRTKAVQSPEFLQRDLEGLNTGRLEDIHLVGHPDVIQPHYTQYTANLPAFLMATATQRKVICGETYFPTVDPAILVPLTLPPITVAPRVPFKKEEDKASFLAKLPGTVQTTIYNRRECYVMSSVTASQASTIPQVDPNVPSSNDSVSLLGLRHYLTTIKILTLFLATHSYPAFQTADSDGANTSIDIDLHISAAHDRKTGHRGTKATYSRSRTSKWSGADTDMLGELQGYPTDESTFSTHGTVHVAKPAPLYPAINYGPPGSIPALPGFLLPYFHGMIYPAESEMVHIMRRFFFGCFGTSPEDRSTKWNDWVQSVSKWHRTGAGMSISHIFFCLQTALECQGRLFVVIVDGKYLGSAILGHKFRISRDKVLLQPSASPELLAQAADLDEHSKAVGEIERALKSMELLEAEDGDVDMDIEVDVSTPRAIHAEFLKRKKVEGEDLENLTEMVGRLAFTQKYWSISGETMERALKTILSDEPISQDLPMYLEPSMIFDGSRIFQTLSAFGPTAPSLVDGGGSDVRIPAGIAADDPESEIPPGSTSIRRPKLYLSSKKLHVACNDMRGVLNKRKIKQNPTERAGGFRTITLIGKQRDIVWTALKMIPVKESVVKGKKRVAADEGEGAAEKVRRVDVGLVEESLGAF